MSNSFVTPWTVAYPTPLFMEFSRKYWRVGCHFLLQGIFLTQGLNICLLHWQADSLPMSHQRSPVYILLLFSCSVMSDSVWPHGLQHARLPCPSTISQSLLKLMSIGLVIPSNHLILCCPLSPPAFSLSQHQSFPMSQLFTSGGQSIGASASASVLPMSLHWVDLKGLISFTIDWFDLLAVQSILKSLLQHYSLKASTVWCSAFFVVQVLWLKPYLWLYRSLSAGWQSDVFAF